MLSYENNAYNCKLFLLTNISTRKYYTYTEITLPIVTALHHKWKNTTKSSAPEDGHKVARNMLSNL